MSVAKEQWVKKGDRCVADDGREGLVRARVHSTTQGGVQVVVEWDDGSGGLVAIERVRKVG